MEPSNTTFSSIILTVSSEIDENLVDGDLVCYVKVELKDNKQQIWQEIGKSSTIRMAKIMTWNYEFEVNYMFQARQPVKFTLLKFQNDQSFIVGMNIVDLGEIIKHPRNEFSLKNISGSNVGKFIVCTWEDKGMHQKIIFKISGEGLADLDYFDKSDPYYRIFKEEFNNWTLVHESKVIMDDLDPKWEPVSMKYFEFCGNNPEALIKIECFDFDSATKSDYIGLCIFRAKEFVTGARFQLKNPAKSNILTGTIIVNRSDIIEEATFLDHLSNGMKINMTLAIDFTSSNGLTQSNNSLHYFSESKESEYAQAIRLLGDVLSKYDSDHQIPVFGFGGIPTWRTDLVKHDFSLTKDENNPFVPDFEQVISIYKSTLPDIELKGPTYFAPIIRRQLRMIEEYKENTYSILIILTDGDLDDYDETVSLIVEASDKPLSIIIVGVGYESFLKMENLDGDQKGLRNKRGVEWKRDIVQFVRFRNFKNNMHHFTEKALEEVPLQLIKYMELKR